MKSIYEANEDYLNGRLNEIEDGLKDYFISYYKCVLLVNEKKIINEELLRRKGEMK